MRISDWSSDVCSSDLIFVHVQFVSHVRLRRFDTTCIADRTPTEDWVRRYADHQNRRLRLNHSTRTWSACAPKRDNAHEQGFKDLSGYEMSSSASSVHRSEERREGQECVGT